MGAVDPAASRDEPLLAQRQSFAENMANGTMQVDDDKSSFFQKGRDVESVATAHSYTPQEQKVLQSFESIEYLPPNNAVYRAYVKAEMNNVTQAWSASASLLDPPSSCRSFPCP